MVYVVAEPVIINLVDNFALFRDNTSQRPPEAGRMAEADEDCGIERLTLAGTHRRGRAPNELGPDTRRHDQS